MSTLRNFASFAMMALILSSIINSSVANQTTAVPVAYRAIVGIVLIIICIFLFYKFFKYAIAGLFVVVILLILLSTTYYFFKTGEFSINYSLKFLADIYNFFAGNSGVVTAANTISHVGIAANSSAAAN
ncbi:MAG: hypothetical protein M1544_01830 [Candidatus Marsarchaeota archaeon]|nr:hypothetical protein [Candidatus Marsarchaeota archaeon]